MLRENHSPAGVLVCGEVRKRKIHSVTKELVGKASELAAALKSEVTCILICGALDDDPADLFSFGADRVVIASHERLELFNQDITVKILSHAVDAYSPEIVLAPATTSGRTYLPALAASLHTGLTADCTGLAIEEGSGLLLQTRPAIGGNVMATIKTPKHVPQMATVRSKTFRVPEVRNGRSGEKISMEISDELLSSRIETIGKEYASGDSSEIQDKEIVISGGRGLKRAEGFAVLEELASMLGGGVGASRPAVEAKWIGYPHQVGLSGKVVSPKLYLAAGISGAVQHLAGMQTARKIVAVNNDPDAPIFRVADIALCGDAADILPRIAKRISEEIKRR